MAVVTERFSIREYTLRMRSIDLPRCWPFDYGSDASPPLPPIEFRRFNWWADELDAVRSAVTVGEVENPSKDSVVAAISEAVDFRPMGMEPSGPPAAGDEGRRTAKGKLRTPKKRSIIELFAAAPVIVGAVGEEDSEEESVSADEEMDVPMTKKKAMKENIIKKQKRRWRRKKKNKEIKQVICGWAKEKISKPKLISSVPSHTFQNPQVIKKGRNAEKGPKKSQKFPTKEKSARKKYKSSRTSILLPRNQESGKKPPVRGILKHQKRSTATRKSCKSVSSKAANLIKLYCKSNKHVSFSIKDDASGNRNAHSSMDLPQLQSLCKIFSDVLAASSALNHSNKGHDLRDDNDRPHEANADVSAKKNLSSDSNANLHRPMFVNSSNSSCSGAEKPSVMVDLNHAFESNDMDGLIPATSTLLTSCIYSVDPKNKFDSHEKNQNSISEIRSGASSPAALAPIFAPPPRDKFVAGSDASSMTFMKNSSSQSSNSCLIVYDKTNERQCRLNVNSDSNFCHKMGEHQSNIRCHSMRPSKFREDFIGLPLNSQGELIQFHYGTKFNEAYDKQNMELGSSHGFSANRYTESKACMNHSEIMRKKELDWNQKHCYSARERVRHWLNFTDSEGSERLEIHKHEPMKSRDAFLPRNSNLRNDSFHEYRNDNAVPNFYNRIDHGHPPIQPTMRLMGQNVVVGNLNGDCNAFNDRRTAKDDENLAERRRFFMPEKPLSQQWMQGKCVPHSIVGRSKEHMIKHLDYTPNFHHMKAMEHPSLDYHQPQWQSHTDSTILNPTFNVEFFRNCAPAENSVGTGHHYPATLSSHPQNVHQRMLLSSPHCRHTQRPTHGAFSSIRPQFKFHNYINLPQQPLPQPVANLPNWLLHAKHEERNQFADSTAKTQPCGASGTKTSHHNSPYHASTIHFDANNIDPNGPSVSNACTSSIPPAKATKLNGDTRNHMSFKKKKRDEMLSKFASFKSLGDARKIVKMSSAKSDLDGVMNSDKADLVDGMMNSDKRPLEERIDSQVHEKPNEMDRPQLQSRSGPTKLIAGAKHILKPCQGMDEENCRLIHSIISPSGDASDKIFGPEKKSANIYKF